MKTVSAIARQYKVSPDTVRHYAKLGLLAPLRCKENGYRYFGAADENRLCFVTSDGNEVVIKVANGTYAPSRISLNAGESLTLLLLRTDESPCSSVVVLARQRK